MADVRWIFQNRAIRLLAEGDASEVIEILNGDLELTEEFRHDLAAFIEGTHPSKVKLKVAQPRGGTKKELTNFSRDYAAHQRICEYREETGKSAQQACIDLWSEIGMGDSALEKLHAAFNKAEAEIAKIDREERGSD
jgi:hypothetical protein